VISFTEDQQLLSSALFHLGDIHRREGQNNKSLKFFEECLLLNPENNDARKIVEDLDKSL
jgi:tetratricopeptide (TPR) repeat protein